MRGRFWHGKPVKKDDLVVLNANLYGERKRIESTIEAFNEISKDFPNLRLWLHGGATKETVGLVKNKDALIISSRIKSSELNLIYNVCQIGLQTSWGEGWSLTNCEHALTGALQVVPDWLACGFHFEKGRGILYPVEQKRSVNEAKKKVIIGVPQQASVNLALKEAINSLTEWDPIETIKYINSYSWESAAEKLNRLIKYNADEN